MDDTLLLPPPPPPALPPPPVLPPPPAGAGPQPANPPSRVVTGAWLWMGALVALAGIAFGVVSVVSLLAHQEHDQTDVVPAAKITSLDIHTDSGAIDVVGADVDTIRIRAHISRGWRPTRYRIETRGSQLWIRGDCAGGPGVSWCDVRLRLVVPRRLAAKVSASNSHVLVRGLAGAVDANSNNGSVQAEDLAGPVTLSSDNGSVRATGLRSTSVTATSDNGSVHLELDRVPMFVSAKSDNGSVDLQLPAGETTYAVETSSDNGSARNLVRSDPASSHHVVATSDNGGVTVHYP